MIEEWNYSAENLLYQFYCVLRGGMGFRAAQDEMQDLKEREGLDDAALRYISRVLELLPKIRECSEQTMEESVILTCTAGFLLEREPQSRRCQDGPTCGW
jgi:hypothetical protein